jgi:hypothetical protein
MKEANQKWRGAVRFGDCGDGIDVYEARLTKEWHEFIEIVG